MIRWSQRHPHIVSAFKTRLDPAVFTGLPLSILVLAFVYVLFLFAGIVEDLITSDPIIAADIRIANLLAVFRTDTLIRVFTWITLLGKSQVIIGFIIASVLLLWLGRKKSYILPLFVAVIGSQVFTYLGKWAFHRPRPDMAVYTEPSFSFPSGHATIAVAFYGFIIYLLVRVSTNWKRKINWLFFGLLVILAIGLSRIYLGEHYLSDVWSGYLVGFMWLIIAISLSEWLVNKAKSTPLRPIKVHRMLPVSIVLSAMVFYVVFAIMSHLPLATASIRPPIVVSNPMDIFFKESTRYTETMIGEKQEPVNLIIIATDNRPLTRAFEAVGWSLIGRTGLSILTETVESVIFHEKDLPIPISLSFWNAKVQDLSFIKEGTIGSGPYVHHVRIWLTDTWTKDGSRIYVGLANATNGVKWVKVPKLSPDLDAERERLFQELNHSGTITRYQKIRMVASPVGKNFIGDPFFTDGMAYIITLR
jgi:undecaprenyl-diphosphatase